MCYLYAPIYLLFLPVFAHSGVKHTLCCVFIIPSPTKLRRDIVTLPSVLPSFHNILVNTLGSTIWPSDLDLWFMTLKINRVPDSPKDYMYAPSLVKIHWRMLILECSQGYYAVKIWPGDLDLWPWKSIGFQILLRNKYG
jgi:hypothetical protein